MNGHRISKRGIRCGTLFRLPSQHKENHMLKAHLLRSLLLVGLCLAGLVAGASAQQFTGTLQGIV